MNERVGFLAAVEGSSEVLVQSARLLKFIVQNQVCHQSVLEAAGRRYRLVQMIKGELVSREVLQSWDPDRLWSVRQD